VALAINADTGEGPHLWPDERERVLRVAVDEAGSIPVVAGLSASFTAQAVEEARHVGGVRHGWCRPRARARTRETFN
jgi:dihydrodipicolinate synthase/N-acetylneuraminate lyase